MMPINVTWYDTDKTTLRWVFEGKWSWSDYEGARTQARQLVGAERHNSVYTIADFRNSQLMPANVLSNFRSSANSDAYELALAVVIAQSMWIESMLGVLNRIYPALGQKVRLAQTPEAGFQIIQTHRTAVK
jgi:hypothetical protein